MNDLRKKSGARRHITAFFISIVTFSTGIAQNASEYLTPSVGSTWRYQRFDLDTAQNIVTGSQKIVVDSLIGSGTFNGVNGYVLKSLHSPPRDSTIVGMNADIISFYNGGYPIEGLSTSVDSLGLGFIPQALGWYAYFKFASPPLNNRVDTLFRRDSTIILDGTEFPLTLIISRIRRPAGVVTVPAGTFVTAVPFEITLNVDTWIFTPLGKFAVPLLKLTDTLFVAKNNWIVKEIQGSTYFPLTAIDNDSVPSFRIPGFVRLLEQQTLTSVERDENEIPAFLLEQNFPNPFNGTTHIPITVRNRANISIEIYDLLGRFVDTVVRTTAEPGTHFFRWDADHHPSGMYLCRTTVNGKTKTHKMILQR